MEQKVDFDEWIKTFQPPEIRYYAKFDNSGAVIGIYPLSRGSQDDMIEIKSETALLIQEGKINLNSCYVDVEKKEFEIRKSTVITGVGPLHRITEFDYAKNDDFDLILKVTNKELIFELAEKYRISDKHNKVSLKWSPATQMSFLITAYNDPNVLFENIRLTIGELLVSQFSYNLSDDVPNDFSVYTRKIFSNYVIIKK